MNKSTRDESILIKIPEEMSKDDMGGGGEEPNLTVARTSGSSSNSNINKEHACHSVCEHPSHAQLAAVDDGVGVAEAATLTTAEQLTVRGDGLRVEEILRKIRSANDTGAYMCRFPGVKNGADRVFFNQFTRRPHGFHVTYDDELRKYEISWHPSDLATVVVEEGIANRWKPYIEAVCVPDDEGDEFISEDEMKLVRHDWAVEYEDQDHQQFERHRLKVKNAYETLWTIFCCSLSIVGVFVTRALDGLAYAIDGSIPPWTGFLMTLFVFTIIAAVGGLDAYAIINKHKVSVACAHADKMKAWEMLASNDGSGGNQRIKRSWDRHVAKEEREKKDKLVREKTE